MSRITELHEERLRVWEQAKGIAERACKRRTPLTPLEERQFDSLTAQLDRLTAEQRMLMHGASIAAAADTRDPRQRLTELLDKRWPAEPQTPAQRIAELQWRRGKWIDE